MGRIRITGMNSGLDTDSMVKELVNAYEKQGEKYTKARPRPNGSRKPGLY